MGITTHPPSPLLVPTPPARVLRPGACLTWSRGILDSRCHILGVPWACRHALCPCRGSVMVCFGVEETVAAALRELSEPQNQAHLCSILGFRGGSCRQRAVVVVESGDVATDASEWTRWEFWRVMGKWT